jgi:diguanylate cyclase (GGDEF)-like protein
MPPVVRWLGRLQWSSLAVFAALLLLPVQLVPPGVRDVVIGNVGYLLVLVIVVARGWLVRPDRAWTWTLAAGLFFYMTGNLYWRGWILTQESPSFPSWADALFLAFYPLAVVAILLLMRARLGRLRGTVLLDGVVGALAAASATALVLSPLLGSVRSIDLETLVAVAYPTADVLVVSVVLGVFSASGGRPGAFYRYFAAGLLVFAVADVVYSYLVLYDRFTAGTPLDITWALGMALVAHSVWRPFSPPATMSQENLASMWVVGLSITVAVGIIAAQTLTHVHLPYIVVLLALATFVAASCRTVLAFARLRDMADVQRLALTDDLTGLANRRAIYAACDQALLAREDDGVVALALLDLDHFKEVNDSLGHQAGDRLLQAVANRLASALDASHPDAMLARLGGDEFAVLVPRAGPAQVAAVTDLLHDALRHPVRLIDDMATLHVSVSTGVALAPEHAQDRTDLMRCADMAMYAAKALNAGETHLYHRGLAEERGDTLRLTEDLREALEHDGLTLAYQPQVDLHGDVRGVEALVRWQRALHGALSPDVFLPVAENHQLMPAVTRAVLSMAVRDCARLRADGHDLTVSVNLSASDLHDGTLPELVRNTLIDHGLPAAALVLEITETNVMVDPVRSERTLLRLHELGVDLSVDDYGTGHCSLSYLRRLPVQELKLDQSFVRDLATEPRDMAIMQSSVGLAHSLDMRLVAEGVEDADALRLLVAAGCDLTQGWYLARPMPYGSLVDWLQVRQRHELARLRPA